MVEDDTRSLPVSHLLFFGAVFDTDLSGVDIQAGLGALTVTSVASAQGVTVGSTVFLSSTGDADYSSSTLEGLGLMTHELAHVLQYRQFGRGNANLGILPFLKDYLSQYEAGLAAGLAEHQAYRNISHEKDARAAQKAMVIFLRKNPQIQQKLMMGKFLTKSDISLVRAYFGKTKIFRKLSRPDPFKGNGFCSADNICH